MKYEFQKQRWTRQKKPGRWQKAAAIVGAAALLVFGIVQIADYYADGRQTEKATEELREIYEKPIEATAEPEVSEGEISERTKETMAPMPAETATVPETSKFASVKDENKDIIAWLTITDQLSQLVMQKK